MRKSSTLDSLLPATRQAILTATLMHSQRWWYLSDLARHLGKTPSSLQRDLAALARAGILRQRREGNRTYFQADTDSPLYPELRGLIVKTTGLVEVLREALAPHAGGIVAAFIYGSFARQEEQNRSDVDLIVVGTASLAQLATHIRRAEAEIGREVQVVIRTPEEFARQASDGHFVREVMARERLFIIGDEHVLGRLAGRRSNRKAPDLDRRTRRPARGHRA
jgi:DNA-binding transcriptional ArsR family regulator